MENIENQTKSEKHHGNLGNQFASKNRQDWQRSQVRIRPSHKQWIKDQNISLVDAVDLGITALIEQS